MQILNNFDFPKILLKHFVFLNDDEKEMVRKWKNNKTQRQYFYQKHTISQEEHLNFIKGLKSDKHNGYWVVTLKPDVKVGVIYLNQISTRTKDAELGLYANPDDHIAGAGNLLMDSLFKLASEKLHLKSLKLSVFKDNLRAIKLYERWGFKEENKSEKNLHYQSKNYNEMLFMRIRK